MDQNEILEKFFYFVSKNKKHLCFQDFQNLEQFISRCNFTNIEFSKIYKAINKLLIHSFKYSIKKKKTDNFRNNDNDPKVNTMGNLNSYKIIFKKSLEFNHTKSMEYQKFIQNLNKLDTLDLKIPLDLFKRFYKNENKVLTEHLYTILEKVHGMISQNNESKKQASTKKKTNNQVTLSDDDSDINKKNRSLNNNHSNDKINQPTSVSDNEIIIKNKEKFYNMMKGLTEKMSKKAKDQNSNNLSEPDDKNIEKIHYSNIDHLGNDKIPEKEDKEKSLDGIKLNFPKDVQNENSVIPSGNHEQNLQPKNILNNNEQVKVKIKKNKESCCNSCRII